MLQQQSTACPAPPAPPSTTSQSYCLQTDGSVVQNLAYITGLPSSHPSERGWMLASSIPRTAGTHLRGSVPSRLADWLHIWTQNHAECGFAEVGWQEPQEFLSLKRHTADAWLGCRGESGAPLLQAQRVCRSEKVHIEPEVARTRQPCWQQAGQRRWKALERCS